MLASPPPRRTVNPVADACEAAGVPCTARPRVPWEAWYFGRGATPEKPCSRTRTTSSFGVAEIDVRVPSLWTKGGVETNRRVGVMWPNDPDGKAIRQGLGPAAEEERVHHRRPGGVRGRDGTSYSAQIAAFKRRTAEIFNTFPLPPGLRHVLEAGPAAGLSAAHRVRIAKTGLLPSQIEALGPLGYGLSGRASGGRPRFPYTSTLTDQTARPTGRRLREVDRQAVEPGHRIQHGALRGRRGPRSEGDLRPRRTGGNWRPALGKAKLDDRRRAARLHVRDR